MSDEPRFIRARMMACGAVELSGLDMQVDNDYGLELRYESVDSLPQWIQTKIKTLQILESPPPPMVVPGVGKKMSDNTYWVYV